MITPSSRRAQVARSTAFAAACACLLVAGLADTVRADPPCWAPAHGYRAKTGDHGCSGHAGERGKGKHGRKGGRHDVDYRQPAANASVQSGSAISAGGLIGAAAGGYAGSHVGKGSGKLAATAGGAVAGYVVGQEIERQLTDPNR